MEWIILFVCINIYLRLMGADNTNWCMNRLTISHKDMDMIKKLIRLIVKIGLSRLFILLQEIQVIQQC